MTTHLLFTVCWCHFDQYCQGNISKTLTDIIAFLLAPHATLTAREDFRISSRLLCLSIVTKLLPVLLVSLCLFSLEYRSEKCLIIIVSNHWTQYLRACMHNLTVPVMLLSISIHARTNSLRKRIRVPFIHPQYPDYYYRLRYINHASVPVFASTSIHTACGVKAEVVLATAHSLVTPHH